jgi:outer membrane protein assembly factor BamB
MQGHDAQRTGRAAGPGPTTAAVSWTFPVGNIQDNSSPVVALDGTIYVAGGDLIAINPDGTEKWRNFYDGVGDFYTWDNDHAPALSPAGDVLYATTQTPGDLRALNAQTGQLVWAFPTPGNHTYSSLAVGADGTIFVGAWGPSMFAVKPDGTLKWHYQPTDPCSGLEAPPAVAPNGSVYFAENCVGLVALDADGKFSWSDNRVGAFYDWPTPSVGPDGTVYADRFAFEPDGDLRWRRLVGNNGWSGGGSPQNQYLYGNALSNDGTLYRARNGRVYAFDASTGATKWACQTAAGDNQFGGSPLLSTNGVLYVMGNPSSGAASVYALAADDGRRLWSYQLPTSAGYWGPQSPALGPNGTLYVISSSEPGSGGQTGRLHAFGGPTGQPPTGQPCAPADAQDPETTIDSGPPAFTSQSVVNFTFSANEAISKFECGVDDPDPWHSCFDDGTWFESVSDGAHTFYVTATDQAGNTDATLATLSFTVDTQPPAAPTLSDTDPDPPANNNNPAVKGTVDAGDPSQVKLYKNGACSGSPAATGSVAAFTGSGITVAVADDTTTQLSARASDAAGNDSACSNSISYVEDSPPVQPTLTGTAPGSPANDNSPRVSGSAESGSTVKLYTTSDCTGSIAAQGTAFEFASGLTVTVEDNSSTTFRATATDVAGNVSSCSTSSITYTEDSTLPPADSDGDGVPDSQDACPNLPANTLNGCPPVGPPGGSDSDGDGILDAVDACPSQPAPGSANGCPAEVEGATDGDDRLLGDSLPNVICGLVGDDEISGGGGDDTLFGDVCNDKAKRTAAAQSGTDGDDELNGDAGNDVLYGAGGADVLRGGDGKDRLFGGDGNDVLAGQAGNDLLNAGRGNDRLTGSTGTNRYAAGSGNDIVSARNGRKESIDCGSGRGDRATVDRGDKVKGCEKLKRSK